jgi:DNA-binding response OmpR family regulator
MQDFRRSILIVEDEESIRTSLAQIFTIMGHRVNCAPDGVAALIEMGKEIPEILLSDLNMPGMSGFELLSVVRLRFPAVRVVAMSGAFSGSQIPSGVAADGFYAKGSGIALLLTMIESLSIANESVTRLSRLREYRETGTTHRGRSIGAQSTENQGAQ